MDIETQWQQYQDRLSIRELVDKYAYCADSRDAQGQMALFTEDTNFEVFYDAKSETPTQVYTGREALQPVFENLNSYASTMHFNGQSTILSLSDNQATGITYTIAHHLTFEKEVQKLMIAHIRYQDRFVKQHGVWLFAERKLKVDWIENR